MNYPRRNGRIAGKCGDTSHSRANNITREMLENSIPGPTFVRCSNGEECRELPDGRVIVGGKGRWKVEPFKKVDMNFVCENNGTYYSHCIVKDHENRFFVVNGHRINNGIVYSYYGYGPRNFHVHDFTNEHVRKTVYDSGNEELIAYFERMRREYNERLEVGKLLKSKSENDARESSVKLAKVFKKRFPEHFGHLKMLFSHENMDPKKRKYESWKTVNGVRNLLEGNLFFHEVFLRALLEEYPEFNKSERRRKNILESLTEE